MKTRLFGKTNLEVSVLGFGCWAIGGEGYGPTDDKESLRALSFAYDHGINFYDTADIYGNGRSEQLVGETFRESSKRLKIFIASKAGWDFYHGGTKRNFSPDYIRFACGESLKRLRTDYLDFYQLHNPRLKEIEKGEIYKILEQLKKEGKIRHYGVSIHVPEEGEAAIAGGQPESLQAIINLIDQRPVPKLFPLAEKNGIGIIAREPLACGLLSGKYNPESKFHKQDHRNGWDREKYLNDLEKIKKISAAFNTAKVALKQAAIEFVLSFSAVSVVIPGIKTAQHAEDHLKAVLEPKLTPADIKSIVDLYQNDELFQTGFVRN